MIPPQFFEQLAALLDARAHALLLARAATELPGITAAIDPAGIRLTAHHLRDRVFGTRHRPRDPRITLFTRGGR